MLQPTPFCNIACDYCYLAERDTRRRMSLEVVEAAVENVRASGMLGASLGVVWHAGEPFAVPRTFYEAAFATVEKRIPCSVALSHSIQTNGTPIDDRWAALFPRRGLRVGVSLDGPAFVHDAHRRTRDGKPTHERLMRGIDALRRHRVAFYAIAVVTETSLDHADAIADFFNAIGLPTFCAHASCFAQGSELAQLAVRGRQNASAQSMRSRSIRSQPSPPTIPFRSSRSYRHSISSVFS